MSEKSYTNPKNRGKKPEAKDKPKHEKESASAAQMHYPQYHIGRKALKHWAATAITPAQRGHYIEALRKVHTRSGRLAQR